MCSFWQGGGNGDAEGGAFKRDAGGSDGFDFPLVVRIQHCTDQADLLEVFSFV